MRPLQVGDLVGGDPVAATAQVLGLAALAALLAGIVAVLYRWYVRDRVPTGLAVLVGLAGVALVLNTTPLLGRAISGTADPEVIARGLFNVVAFVTGGTAAAGAARVGDRLGARSAVAAGAADVDVSEIVGSVGRVTAVRLPGQIGTPVGYDPVPTATVATLSDRTFLFPRRLTREELRERLITRLRTDYGVGQVDLELDGDGEVERLDLGARAAGIGPTLPPATVAVAIRADPGYAAGTGDLVQVWRTDPRERVAVGELRGAAGDVVTVAVDAADADRLDPTVEHRLVTLPAGRRPDREFVALLRTADETVGRTTVAAGSPLDGGVVGDVGATVVAVAAGNGRPEAIPTDDRPLAAGDVLHFLGTPDTLRRVEAAAGSRTRTDGDGSGDSSTA